jgi:hypothetical protein
MKANDKKRGLSLRISTGKDIKTDLVFSFRPPLDEAYIFRRI